MADYQTPSGPPPPAVPEGWVARWNEQYSEWFYVNTHTKQSQWEKPTAPAHNPDAEAAIPDGPPPGYVPGPRPEHTGDVKSAASTNPFVNETTKPAYDQAGGSSSGGGGSGAAASYLGSQPNQHPPSANEDADARLARQLQEEEDARARSGGQHGAPMPPASHSPYPDQLPPRPGSGAAGGGGGTAEKSRGLFNKLKNKLAASSSSHHGAGHYGGGGYPGGHHGPPQHQYSQHQQQYAPYGQQPGYGQPGYGYGSPHPQQGYYGGPAGGSGFRPPFGGGGFGGGHGGYGGYGGGGGRRGGGGMGMAGGAALGAGAGLLGGAMIASAVSDHNDYEEQQAYQEGFSDGADGGDFDGGGDFGGDF